MKKLKKNKIPKNKDIEEYVTQEEEGLVEKQQKEEEPKSKQQQFRQNIKEQAITRVSNKKIENVFQRKDA